jgi:hypothetical protein
MQYNITSIKLTNNYYNMTTTTTESRICYPYAYGRLDAGVNTFADHFRMMARMKGIEISDEAHAHMKEMLEALSRDTDASATEHYTKYA